ncbi:hypothetical protein ATY76_22460 [Rhizobium sp. R339]|uniref:hypothetical protein n=1 Tax=Rhizobium sp. R339 TaxID=1764273 RepID=UPI000B5334C8|nr:hypothetical protein [Rhizobium sp. R339]OWV64211.1 hypothetical protein ATY76_22460 [Rhizobium sp. R339]
MNAVYSIKDLQQAQAFGGANTDKHVPRQADREDPEKTQAYTVGNAFHLDRLHKDIEEPLGIEESLRGTVKATQLDFNAYRMASNYNAADDVVCRIDNAQTIFVCAEDMVEAFDLPRDEKAAVDCSRWLEVVGGVMSLAQMENLLEDGKPIDLSRYRCLGSLRPPKYGRAAILATKSFEELDVPLQHGEGLLDVKGCGVPRGRVPIADFNHNNGVLFLHEAIREFTNYSILLKLSRQSSCPFDVLPHFGIVDLKMSLKMADLPPLPLCTMVRAAHFRDPENCERPEVGSPMLARKLEIERYLQQNGLTSTTDGYKIWNDDGVLRLQHHRKVFKVSEEDVRRFARNFGLGIPSETNGINVQLCDMARWGEFSQTLVDFQHYRRADSYLHETSVALSRDGWNYWGDSITNLLTPHPNINDIRRLLGEVSNVETFYDEMQYSWLKNWNGLLEMTWCLEIFSLRLTYDYMFGMRRGQELYQAIQSYATECFAVLTCRK